MQTADRFRLELMLEACEKLAELVAETDRTAFEADYKTYTSIIKTIEMIGESAARVSKELQDANLSIPWKQLIGFRNRLIHVYWDIDFDIVWTVATQQMPVVSEQLVSLLKT